MSLRSLLPLLVGFLALSAACNKEVDTVPLPPFSVFPNPFTEQFSVYLDGSLPAGADIRLRVLNGKEEALFAWDAGQPGSAIAVSMTGKPKAVYYVELTVDRTVFIQPIIKVE